MYRKIFNDGKPYFLPPETHPFKQTNKVYVNLEAFCIAKVRNKNGRRYSKLIPVQWVKDFRWIELGMKNGQVTFS